MVPEKWQIVELIINRLLIISSTICHFQEPFITEFHISKNTDKPAAPMKDNICARPGDFDERTL